MLKPGGRFALVTTPKHKLAPFIYGPWYPALKLYSDSELADMFLLAGFKNIEVHTLDIENQIGYGIKI